MNWTGSYYGFVYVDLAQIMRAYSEGMMRAFMMGRQMQPSAEGTTMTAEAGGICAAMV